DLPFDAVEVDALAGPRLLSGGKRDEKAEDEKSRHLSPRAGSIHVLLNRYAAAAAILSMTPPEMTRRGETFPRRGASNRAKENHPNRAPPGRGLFRLRSIPDLRSRDNQTLRETRRPDVDANGLFGRTW